MSAPSVLFDLRFSIEDGDTESSLSFLLAVGDWVRDTNLSSVPALESLAGAPNRGGLGGLNPPKFWMGGLNTCQPPPDFEKKFLGRVGSPLIDLTIISICIFICIEILKNGLFIA